MFERDYIVEIVGEFARRVGLALRRALDGDRAGITEAEREVADLLELDPQVALALAPDALVTMMVLSGMGDAVASYVCYALERVARLHDRADDEDLAGLRHLQAKAVAESFGCDPDAVPEGFEGLEL